MPLFETSQLQPQRPAKNMAGTRLCVLVGVAIWLLISGMSALPVAVSSADKYEVPGSMVSNGQQTTEPRRLTSFSGLPSKLGEFRRPTTEQFISSVLGLLNFRPGQEGEKKPSVTYSEGSEAVVNPTVRLKISLTGSVHGSESKGESVRIPGQNPLERLNIAGPEGSLKVYVESDRVVDPSLNAQRGNKEDDAIHDGYEVLTQQRLIDDVARVVQKLPDTSRSDDQVLPLPLDVLTTQNRSQIPTSVLKGEALDYFEMHKTQKQTDLLNAAPKGKTLDHFKGANENHLEITKTIFHNDEKNRQTEKNGAPAKGSNSKNLDKEMNPGMNIDEVTRLEEKGRQQTVDDRVASLEEKGRQQTVDDRVASLEEKGRQQTVDDRVASLEEKGRQQTVDDRVASLEEKGRQQTVDDRVTSLEEKGRQQTVDDRVASLEQDTQAIMEQEKDIESIIDQSLRQLKDWIKSETVEETHNASQQENFKQPNGSESLSQTPGSDTGSPSSPSNLSQTLSQISQVTKDSSERVASQGDGTLNSGAYFIPDVHVLKQENGKEYGKTNNMKVSKEEDQSPVIKMFVDNINVNSKPKTIGNPEYFHDYDSNLPMDDNQQNSAEGKTTVDARQNPAHAIIKSVENKSALIEVKPDIDERKLKNASPSLDTKMNKSLTAEPALTPQDSSNPPSRRPKRSMFDQPLRWYSHDVFDKTQRRSTNEQDKHPVHESQTIVLEANLVPAVGSDLKNDSALFVLGYEKFLEKLALKANEKHKKADSQNISDTKNNDGNQNGKTPLGDSHTQGNGDPLSFKLETNKNMVSFESVATGKAPQTGTLYEIRDDNEDTDDYDDWIETLEFRKRRMVDKMSNGNDKKRAVRQQIALRRRNRSSIKDLTRKRQGENPSYRERKSKNGHKSLSWYKQRRSLKQGQDYVEGNHGIVMKSRATRNAKSDGNTATGRGSAKNHTLLDEADILFIVKHKHPSQAAQRLSKPYSGGHPVTNNNNSSNSNSNKKAGNNGSYPNHPQKESFAFLKTFYHVKSEKKKSWGGKTSRHVPHEDPHSTPKQDTETTTRSTPSGPSVKRITPQPPFPMNLPGHPMRPFLPHLDHGPGPVNLVWKHHNQAHRHGAAILVFLCVGVILFIALVLVLSKATNTSSEPQRNDSSTALYVSYPHY